MPIVVDPRNLVPRHDLFFRGLLLGLVCILLALGGTIVGMALPRQPVGVTVLAAYILGGLVLPIYQIHRRRGEIGSARRAFIAGMGFGTGMVIAPVMAFSVFFLVELGPAGGLGMSAAWVAGMVVWCCLTGGLAMASWTFVKDLTDAVVIQDGTLCPGCAYSLIGNDSMVCPECGRGYTHKELGVATEATT